MENNLNEEGLKLINSSQSEIPTSLFDTYKGLLFMFFSCLLRSLFGILCKYALFRNEELTSYHLLFYKVNFMLIIFSILIITIYKRGRKIIDSLTNYYSFFRYNFIKQLNKKKNFKNKII